MSSPIPKIGAEGLFKLKTPFDTLLQEGKTYKCIAIRRFPDLRSGGFDVYRQFYFVHDIAVDSYNRDDLNNEVILSLVSDFAAPVYVPSSYVESFPNADNIPYSRVVISASVGPVADDMNLAALTESVGNSISDTIGIVPKVAIHLAPHDQTISSSQHEVIEANRIAAIKNRSTDYVRVRELEQENQRLLAQIEALKKSLIDAKRK